MNKIVLLSCLTLISSNAYCSGHIHIETHQNDNGEGARLGQKMWDSFCEGVRQTSQAVEHVCEAGVDTFGKNRPDSMRGTGFFKDWKENAKK